MAYPNYYNGGYFPQYQNGAVPDVLGQYKGQYQQPIMQQPIQQPIQSNGGLIWVDNEEQAKNYLVAPNNVVPMFDKSSSAMYIKSSDGAGMPTFKKYKLVDVDEETPKNAPTAHKCTCGDKFATKEQLSALEGKINDILAMYDELKEKQTTKTNKKAKESEE